MTDRKPAALVPELACTDAAASAAFYTSVLGFDCLYSRPAQGFFYLSHQGAELMLEQLSDDSWLTAPDGPLGCGMHLQIMTDDVGAVLARCMAASARIFRPMETAWYKTDAGFAGQRQFVVLDPDGYMLRFAQDLGARATAPDDAGSNDERIVA